MKNWQIDVEREIRRDVERYATNECKRIRGCQKKMDYIENLLDMCEDKTENLNEYAMKVLEYLVYDLRYMENARKLSAKAMNRWKALFMRLTRS